MKERIDFLKSHEPFVQLSDAVLKDLAEQLIEIAFDRSETIYEQHLTKVEGLDIIRSGSYETFFYNSQGKKEAIHELGALDNYGAFSILLNKGKSIFTVSVEKGTRIFRIPGKYFRALCESNEKFYQYFLTAFGKEMLHEEIANHLTTRSVNVDSLSFDRYFNRRLDSVNVRPIVSCRSDAPVHEVAWLMETNKLSCIFVEKEGVGYVGYVTDIILRNKIIAAQKDAYTRVEDVMEGPIYTISRDLFVYEAIMLMFDKMIRYLIVEENGEQVGVISRNKLLSDQAQSPFVFIQSVRLSMSVEELKNKWADVPEVVYNLLTRGVKSEYVNQVITNISDTIAQKVIEGVIKEVGPPPAKFVFMSLGSEGRMEQTLKTDQDNAIIYEDKANEFRKKTRKYFLHFADLVSERLNEIGFSFCTGGLMAKNPNWTHSLSHWKRNYNEWIEDIDPQSVMNFSTFFDCRLIYGEKELIDELQSHILKKLEDPGEYFFSQLAKNAMQYEPSLTFFRGIRTISKGDQQVFNIKRAMTPLVDLVRVYALKYKVITTNTGDRLVALKELKVMSEEDFKELMQSYYYLMGIRLKYQAQKIIYDHEAPDNFVSLESLSKIEVVTIKEIFKVIENFQQRIKMVFTRQLFG